MLCSNGRQILPGTGAGRPIERLRDNVIRKQLPQSNLSVANFLKLSKDLSLSGCANTKENSP